MTLLAPAFLAFLGLAIPILLLYMLKLHRREVDVSSLYLWEQVILDREANAPWQRLRRNLLLILQLIFLGLIALALSRPAVPTSSLASGSLVVLLDASASMQAQDSVPNRFTAAQEAVRKLILNLEPESKVTLIFVDDHPKVIAAGETDPSLLLSILDATSPTNSEADWPTAAALAAGASQVLGQQTTTIFVTDGGVGDQTLPFIAGEVRYIPIGTSGDNVAVSNLALENGPNGAQLFAKISNYGPKENLALVSVYRDTELIHARQMTIPSGQDQTLILTDLPSDPAPYEVRLTNPSSSGGSPDFLPLDNQGYFPLRSEQSKRGILITNGNFFLEQLLSAFPNITFLQALGDENAAIDFSQNKFDLYLFDGLIPSALPTGNLLFINPPANELFSVGEGLIPIAGPVHLADSQLARHLSWDNVHIRAVRPIELPSWGDPLVTIGNHPLVFTGEIDERRIAVISFDLLASDLPLSTTYPILMANLIDFLTPTNPLGLPATINPGETLSSLSGPAFEDTILFTPAGEEIHLDAGQGSLANLTLADPGIYTIQTTVDNEEYIEHVAVNFQTALESRITPAEEIHSGTSTTLPRQATDVGKREFWRSLVVAGLFLIIIEWWVYHNQGSADWRSYITRLRKELESLIHPILSRIRSERRLS